MTYSAVMKGETSAVVEASGHLIDSGLLHTIFDAVIAHEGAFEVQRFEIGRTNNDGSELVLRVSSSTADGLDRILEGGLLVAGVYIVQGPPGAGKTILANQTCFNHAATGGHAVYVTLNDVEESGVRRPFEIFINSKNMDHYAWTVGLTRMISAVFRRGGDVGFVADELKAVFDPRGGAWLGGRYVPSLLAAIGGVIERHLGGSKPEPPPSTNAANALESRPSAKAICPHCGGCELIRKEGCDSCLSCGYSKCG